ncbi:unnamed protein product [Meganyctiphanes norvegica]|uniref:Alanine racemase C-terminal domain-containing protein n=1 Tax=Meganyctiphanes norvegica TaxID=48144 RepID=A0AAV2S7B8_MEGNR
MVQVISAGTLLVQQLTKMKEKGSNMDLLCPSPTRHAKVMEDLTKEVFSKINMQTFIHINLDAIAHNVKILKSMAGPETEINAVIKDGAYGTGLLPATKAMLEAGVTHFTAACVNEAVYLRKNGIKHVPISVLGNLSAEELPRILEHNLMPSISWIKPLLSMPKEDLIYQDGQRLNVNINIDTGLHRYGVKPDELPAMVDELDNLGVGIHSMYTHYARGVNATEENTKQFDEFLKATKPYMHRGIKLHSAATSGLIQRLGHDLGYIRIGKALLGLSCGNSKEVTSLFASYGFTPVLSVVAKPSFYKKLPKGSPVGYDGSYVTQSDEWIANFRCGWGDGYNKRLGEGKGYIKRLRTGI